MGKVYQFPDRPLPTREPEPARDEVVHAAITRFGGRCVPILDCLVHEQSWSRAEAHAKLIEAVDADWSLSWWTQLGPGGVRMIEDTEVRARPALVESCFIGGVLF